ncbi:MAG TPA: hypothetical protein VJ180_02220 [Pyrinomonadaceae bacterium]|nr:hypothetical protein [Pyrinomonadaceae bacterium]
MTQTNRFSLMLEALTELVAEEKQSQQTESSDASQTGPAPALPSLRDVIASNASMPREALCLGLAEDGLPVLLNLYDPVPGPLLVAGDQGSGKTRLLQVIARSVELVHAPAEVEFGVITNHVDDWDGYQEIQNNAGIYPLEDSTSQDFVHSLVSWAHNNKGEKQSVLLLIDDLISATQLSHETQQDLRWLLLRGPSRRVWPIVTMNAALAENVRAWLGFFRTRLFGHIQNAQEAEFVTGLQGIRLDDLIPGSQFTLREGKNWLNFWIPTIE